MSSQIFTKEVILHLKRDTRIPVIACVLGSNYGSILNGIYHTGNGDRYHMEVHALACDKVDESGFYEYDCVENVEIRNRV